MSKEGTPPAAGVTQADRDAAAEYVGANFGVKYVQATKTGSAWTGLAEAFARHRQQALAQQVEEVARLREALTEQVAECFDDRCEMCARHESILNEQPGGEEK